MFNLRLTDKLEERGFSVFLPQRDGVESSQPPYDEMTNDERRQAIFSLDRDKVWRAVSAAERISCLMHLLVLDL